MRLSGPLMSGLSIVALLATAAVSAHAGPALKAVYDDVDDVPDALKEQYVEKDGKFYLNVGDDINEHPLVVALKNAHTRQKGDNKKLKDDLAAAKARLEGLPDDFNAEAYAELVRRAEETEAGLSEEEKKKRREEGQRAGEQYEQRIKAMEAKHKAAIDAKDAIIAARDAQIDKLIVDTALDQAMDAAQIEPKFRKPVRAMLRGEVRVVEGDEENTRAAVVKTDLNPETPLAQYVTNWAQSDEGRIFVGQPKGGDGGGSGGGGGKEANPWDPKTTNRTDQGKIFRADPAKARRLAAKHGITIPERA